MILKKFVLITPGSINVVLIPNWPSSYLIHSPNPSNAKYSH